MSTMDKATKSSLSRSSSRSRRSQMNLADLRLSPLTTRFTEPSTNKDDTPSTADEPHDVLFRRSHSSYIQGKSAPTTPGILSRSSSRKHLSRTSLHDYDDDAETGGIGGYDYAGVVRGEDGSARIAVGSGQILKAKSEAALLVQRSKTSGKSAQAKRAKLYQARSRMGGMNTPHTTKSKGRSVDDDWLTRTGAATNALLQEGKGQSWMASRDSSTALAHLQDTTDEEDEGYEELAAQSVGSTSARDVITDGGERSARASKWGSRYGSRTASRRTSRRGSVSTLTAGSRTPLAPPGQDGAGGILFADTISLEPDFVVDGEEEGHSSQDEAALNRLAETNSFGIGGIMDRIMKFSLFQVEEREEGTEDDDAVEVGESDQQARERMEAEKERRREAKERLVLGQQGGGAEGEGHGEGGSGDGSWAGDAAWLLGVVGKAMFE